MTTPEPTTEEALIMAEQCPVIRSAYASGDDALIAFAEKNHPPSRCDYVKQAHAKPGTANSAPASKPPSRP